MHERGGRQNGAISSRVKASTNPPGTPKGPAAQKRRVFRWSKEARDLVREYLETAPPRNNRNQPNRDLSLLVTRLTMIAGHPRDACLRFVRQLGVVDRNPYKVWTAEDKQRLLDLSARFLLKEVARLMGRSYGSVRSMLHHLGATARMGRDWFTLYVLAEALHIDSDEVQRWIDRGWLKCRVVAIGDLKRFIITADDFDKFCRSHPAQVVGRRINRERLEFIRTFVFPPSHADLLPVRESKKERVAYEEQSQIVPKIGPRSEPDEEQEVADWVC